jgi:hypothetical protein
MQPGVGLQRPCSTRAAMFSSLGLACLCCRFGTPSGFSGSLRSLASWQPAPGNATLVTDAMRALPTLNSNMLRCGPLPARQMLV